MPNAYLDHRHAASFLRSQVLLLKYSYAFVVMPGGFGTMDEFFRDATLIQTGKISDFPVVLMGKGLLETAARPVAPDGTRRHRCAKDLEHLIVTDEPGQALAHPQTRHR